MADSYTTRLKIIKPDPGGSLNTWGTKLNDNNFDSVDVAVSGTSALTITGDTTLTLASGDDTSTQLPILHRYGGAPSAAFGVTYVAQEFLKLVHNASGVAATPKVSSGFSMPNGAISFIAYNSAYGDVTNVTPNYVGTGYTVSANGHIANKAYVDAAVAAGIAAASISNTGQVLISVADTTSGYLGTKLAAGTGVTLTDSGAGNSTLTIAAPPYWNDPRSLAFADSPITALDRDILRLDTSGGAITVNLPASGRVQVIDATGDAASNNVTLTPAGADTITFGTIDTNYFGAAWLRVGTNWDLA